MYSADLYQKSMDAVAKTQLQFAKKLSLHREELTNQKHNWMRATLDSSIVRLEDLQASLSEDSHLSKLHKKI